MNKFLRANLFLLFGLSSISTFGQGVYVPLNRDYYHILDRYEIKSGRLTDRFHTTHKMIRRQDIAAFVEDMKLDSAKQKFNRRDKFNLDYLKSDNWEWSSDSGAGDSKHPIRKTFFKNFYKKQNAFFSVQTKNKDFEMQINPILYFSGGYQLNSGSDINYINLRGLEMRGMICRRLGFYTMIGENQVSLPGYQQDFIARYDAVPEETFYKQFKQKGVDVAAVRGYLTFTALKNQLQFQAGHDRLFIGNGFRSLMFGDFAPNFLFAKINMKVWKISYDFIVGQGLNNTGYVAYKGFDKKMISMHHLSINCGKHFNFGIFEAIVTADRFEINYLNPIIFYRSLENALGSKDAAHLGIDFKANFLRRFQLYGQLVINEANVKGIMAGNGSWRNQQAVQLGLKYVDAFWINNLDLQFECNYVRPYMYTDKVSEGGFTHYNQPWAHPLGANFIEYLGVLRYQPHKRINMNLTAFYAKRGLDADTSLNFGSNPLKPYTTRELEEGNYTATKGAITHTAFVDFTLSYMVRHNLFLDLKGIYRNQVSDSPNLTRNDVFGSVSLRMNIAQRQTAF